MQVGLDETGQLAEGGVPPAGGLARQQQNHPEIRPRWLTQLVFEEVHDLRSPQELVLQVDQVLRASERPAVLGEDRELAVGQEAVDLLRHRPQELRLVRAGRFRHRRRCQPLTGHLTPAGLEMGGDINDHRATETDGRIVPAQALPRLVSRRVPPVGGDVGQIEPTDEGHLVVDDQELLVVAVLQVLVGVQCNPDTGNARERVPRLSSVRPRRPDHGELGATPQENPELGPPSGCGERLPEGRRSVAPGQQEVGCGIPAGEVHAALSALDRSEHRSEGRLTVDEDLDAVPDTNRRGCGIDGAVRGPIEDGHPTVAGQPTAVVTAEERFDQSPDSAVHPLGDRPVRGGFNSHGSTLPPRTRSQAVSGIPPLPTDSPRTPGVA